MAEQFSGIVRTTELESLNTVLSVLGEAPVLQAELDSPSLPDTVLAVNIIRETVREVLSMRWRWNVDFGFEIVTEGSFAWTDTDGDSETLNAFLVPDNLLSYDWPNTGSQGMIEVGVRPATTTQSALVASVTVGDLVFYDRVNNREGFEVGDFDRLYITAIFASDFTDMPEVARRYITVKAARRAQARMVGSAQLEAFTQADEGMALRNLRREQAIVEDLNIFNSPEMSRKVGGGYRYAPRGSFFDNRGTPGSA